jgi:glutathione S-transferase
MLTLHYAPDNASVIVRLALEEAGLAYRTALVDRRARQQDSAAYRRLNPAGLIPVLETPDGPVAETGAILLWLADRHPGTGLFPGPGSPERGKALQWLFFLSNTLHADLRQVFYPHLYVGPEGRDGHHARITGRLRQHFALVEAVADTAVFAPPSILGFYATALARWARLYTDGQPVWFGLNDFPVLWRLAADLERRPSWHRAALAEGLGERPLTDPRPAVPPEGTAL